MPDPALTNLLASYTPNLIQKRVARNLASIDSHVDKDFLMRYRLSMFGRPILGANHLIQPGNIIASALV